MKRLLFAILLAGCTTAPHRATIAKVAHVAVAGSAFETGLPECDPQTVSLAMGYLEAAAVSLWMGLPPSLALSNVGVGQAIEGALPPNTTRQSRIKLLYEAEASLSPSPRK